MRVVLINPPSGAPNPVLPLGLAFIASELEKNGFEVSIVDAWAEGYSHKQLGEIVSRLSPEVVGITIMSPLYGSGMLTVDTVRQSSKATIVVGGPHPSALPQECLQTNKNIDYVVIGEGEKTLVRLLQALQSNNRFPADVPGIAFRSNDDAVVRTGHADRIPNLDDCAFPALHLFPLKKYKTHPPYGIKNRYMTMITSRGCPFGCSYCSKSVFGTAYRAMSPQKVYEWTIRLKERYETEEIHFYDDDFTIDKSRVDRLCDLFIENKVRMHWSCTTRVDLVDENLLRKMRKGGCWLISYGIESADDEVLRNAKKGYTLQDVKKAFLLTKQCGIATVGFFMAGLPGETKQTLDKTIDFSLLINPDFVSWGITAVYPGSPLYDSIAMRPQQPGSTPVISRGTQGHASGSPFGSGYAVLYECGMSRAELQDYVKRANKKFYLRIAYIISFFSRIRSPYHFMHYMKGGLKVFWWIARDRFIRMK